MKRSSIQFQVSLDAQNIPEKIEWKATDGPSDALEEIKAVSISLWDPKQENTLRLDLWTKEMNVFDMKRFTVETLDGLAECVSNATGDEVMASEIRDLCKRLAKHVETTTKAGK
ncbi:MAG: gliding motility protein GldC [Cytophagaceae bacterium]|jgi:gliding motility-associated protein GldC|nr:gliding motility protein GldC [Cytophagaceae bacterium]